MRLVFELLLEENRHKQQMCEQLGNAIGNIIQELKEKIEEAKILKLDDIDNEQTNGKKQHSGNTEEVKETTTNGNKVEAAKKIMHTIYFTLLIWCLAHGYHL